MKKSVLASMFTVGLAASFSANCQTHGEISIPSLEEQFKMGNEIKFQAVVDEVQSSDGFSGVKTTLVSPNGVKYVIDRTAEPLKRSPGNPPPRLETLNSLLGSLEVTARGNVHVNVERTFYPDGTLKSESWNIDIGGSWQAESGMGDANDKAHK